MLRLTYPLKRCTTNTNISTKSKDDSVDGASNLSSTSPSPLKRCINSVDGPSTLSLSPSPLRRCIDGPPLPHTTTTTTSDLSLTRRNYIHNRDSINPERAVLDVFYRPSEGQSLEVIPFLSYSGKTKHLVRSNGDKVGFDVVLGKHILICCVSLPLTSGDDYFRSMITSYSELSRRDFEMVLVPHIKPGFPHGNALFYRLFSSLPCLAIPFSDVQTRDYICSFLGFNLNYAYEDVSAILVDPSQRLLHYIDATHYFRLYGSDFFPFLKSNIAAIVTQDADLLSRLDPLCHNITEVDGRAFTPSVEPLSLHKDILLCDPSLVLPIIGHVGAAKQQSITVSELGNMYVGLYLCTNGDFLDQLIKVHQHCVAKEQELVIVVVCVPIYWKIESLQKKIKRRLEKCNITWFIFPDINKVWRRLWRVFVSTVTEDNLFILPPNCKNGELDGKLILQTLGVSSYPFMRSAVLERTFTALRSLTPASIFKGTTKKRTCLVRSNIRNVRQSHLKGKKLLVYLDWLDLTEPSCSSPTPDLELCHLLMNNYPKIQAMGWEVVFVPLDVDDKGEPHAMISKMPWPVMPLSNALETNSMLSLLVLPGEFKGKQIVAFDEDGRIVSVHADMKLEKCGFDNSLFDDILYEQIVSRLLALHAYCHGIVFGFESAT